MGIFTAAAKLNIALDDDPLYGNLAFISQSGTYGGNLARVAKTKGYGLRTFISLGNQADVSVSELLAYLAQDVETKVIVLYLEGAQQGRRFFETARQTTRKKPILVYKAGRSDEGSRATMSHTASIAGSDEIFDAMCKQAGIIRVNEMRTNIMQHNFIQQNPFHIIGQHISGDGSRKLDYTIRRFGKFLYICGDIISRQI